MGLQKSGVLFLTVLSFVFLLFAFANFSIIQAPFVSAGPNNSTGGGSGNGTNITHLACVNSMCTSVSGNGTNQCSPLGSSCGNVTHLACVNYACAQVSGSGSNTCSVVGSFCNMSGGGGGNGTGNQTHLTCLNNTCSLVTGSGNNTCSPVGSFCGQPPQNQTHLACVNRLCVVVNGTGVNQCSTIGVKCLLNNTGNSTFATARLSPGTVECSGFVGFFKRLFGRC